MVGGGLEVDLFGTILILRKRKKKMRREFYGLYCTSIITSESSTVCVVILYG